LLSRLRECDLQRPTVPLFLPAIGNLGYRLVSPGVPVSKPQALRKILPRVFTVFGTKPALLALFGWHSCRRGSATHGYGDGVPMDLLASHEGWFTVQGLKAYTPAAFVQQLSVRCRASRIFSFFACLFAPSQNFVSPPTLPPWQIHESAVWFGFIKSRQCLNILET